MHEGAFDFALGKRPGFYVGFCLWLMYRLRPQRLGDPVQEVLVPMSQGENSAVNRLRSLIPMGHCVLLVVCQNPRALFLVHRVVTDRVNSAQVGCWADSIKEPMSVAPHWGVRTANSLMYCPLRLAIRREAAVALLGLAHVVNFVSREGSLRHGGASAFGSSCGCYYVSGIHNFSC